MDMNSRKFQKQIQYADDKKYPYCLIIGEDEARSGKYVLKDMKTGEQRKIEKSSISALFA
jgi:histidyl-tRNA synthetase